MSTTSKSDPVSDFSTSAQQFFDRGQWWRKDGAFRLLHDINPLRLQLVMEAVGAASATKTNRLAGKRLLDIGCGGGIFTESAALAGARATGCDISAGAIAAAQQHAEQEQIAVQYRQGGVDLSEAGQYDVATCFEMLEHCDDPAGTVADIAAMLAPGGVAVFSTINRTLRAFAQIIVGLEYTLQILPHGTHEYRKFISPKELAKMCEDGGLSVRRVCGLEYSFFGRRYFLREDRTSANYFIVASRKR